MKRIAATVLMFSVPVALAGTLTFVTLTGAGSLSDTAIRQAAPAIEATTGKSVVVVNAPGANGLLGIRKFLAEDVNSTYLVGNSSIGYLSETAQLPAVPTPVTGLAKTALEIFVSASTPDLQSLLAKKQLKAGSTSPMTKIALALFDAEYRVVTTVVGYQQFSASVLDLANGRIDYLIAPAGAAILTSVAQTGKIHSVGSRGAHFGWNGVYAHPHATNNAEQQMIALGVSAAALPGLSKFSADAAQLTALQQVEAAEIRRALALMQLKE